MLFDNCLSYLVGLFEVVSVMPVTCVFFHASHRIFHHGEEEKGSNVAKAVDVLVDCGEALPQIVCPLQQ